MVMYTDPAGSDAAPGGIIPLGTTAGQLAAQVPPPAPAGTYRLPGVVITPGGYVVTQAGMPNPAVAGDLNANVNTRAQAVSGRISAGARATEAALQVPLDAAGSAAHQVVTKAEQGAQQAAKDALGGLEKAGAAVVLALGGLFALEAMDLF